MRLYQYDLELHVLYHGDALRLLIRTLNNQDTLQQFNNLPIFKLEYRNEGHISEHVILFLNFKLIERHILKRKCQN